MLTNVQGEPDLLKDLTVCKISVFDEEGKISLVNNDGLKEAMNVYMDLINGRYFAGTDRLVRLSGLYQ